MSKLLNSLLAVLIATAMFCFGVVYGQTIIEPVVTTQVKYIPKYIEIVEEVEVIHEVEVIKEIYPAEFQQFNSQDELSKWQVQQYPELKVLGGENGWICVDYALELQRRAWEAGFQMSVENLLDKGGKTGHAICSTWIGNECIYLEPQSTYSWVGAVRGDVGIVYRPIFFYPDTGKEVYREE